ncbi:MAG: recombinase RecA [Candidatus Omnitrophica bacterium]|nr:recombinase RecA [Candidatus Omnitrophota bacterium]
MDKEKILEMTISQIEKEFGKGAIMKLGEKRLMEVEVIPTGAISLDIALGVGGIPRGRVTEIFGQESSGKTTLALQILAQAQKYGGTVAFIDAEHALDPNYAKALGVKLEDMLVSQPDTGEQALEIAEALIRSNAIDVVVIDSVAALVPRAELEGEMGDSVMGLQARLMSQALRKLTGYISKSKTAAIFINQVREKIGVFFGNPETTPGGRALKFYASVRLEVRKVDSIKRGNDIVGSRIKVKVVKNKVAPPFKETELEIYYGQGISKEASLIEAGLSYGIIEKKGSYYSYQGKTLGQGIENIIESLKKETSLYEEIDRKIREKVGLIKIGKKEENEVLIPERIEETEVKKGGKK